MAVTKTRYGSYIELTGTAAEVLAALSAEKVSKAQLRVLKDDGTYAVFARGNP
jgi:hypothetical protein